MPLGFCMTNNVSGHTIGKNISIKGDLSGEEDLVVEGYIEGSINLKSHLLVGETGVVLADIQSESLTVYGEVRGNVVAASKIEVHENAKIVGDIRAPVIYLADGAKFRGMIEMEVPLPRDF